MKRVLHYQILVFITHGKTKKAHAITINLKYQHQHGMINLNCLMDCMLYQIFKIILSLFKKNRKLLKNHQYKYMSIKSKIGLHLKLKKDIALNF